MPNRSSPTRISRNSSNAIALNPRAGDFIYVLLSGVLSQHDIDIGGTRPSSRWAAPARALRALLAGRVAAVPLHFDQAAEIVKQGNYKVLDRALARIQDLAVRNPGSFRVPGRTTRTIIASATDLIKAMIKSFRMANADLAISRTASANMPPFPTPRRQPTRRSNRSGKKMSVDIRRLAERWRIQREYFRIFSGLPQGGRHQGRAPIQGGPRLASSAGTAELG